METTTSEDGDDRPHHSRIDQNHLCPNQDLTEEEKSQKRGLKRLLKRQTRRKKLETRLQQAIMRVDAATEEWSRKELATFLQEEENELLKTQSLLVVQSELDPEADQETLESHQMQDRARDEIEPFYQRYYKLLQKEQKKEQLRLRENGNPSNQDTSAYDLDAAALKEKQLVESKELLANMTKGTQQVHMFESQAALMGYVRQKFQERACLSVTSLAKLDPRRSKEPNHAQLDIWKRLLAVRSICSIGCGPGCDALGNIKFLEHFAAKNHSNTPTIVDRVLFLDWTMDKWQFFLHPLIDQILVPKNFCSRADVAFGDVLKRLSDESNAVAKKLLLQDPSIDLFVTSYLLTETRGKWHDFYSDIIDAAKPGALFLFAEPKAWQLHSLIKSHANHVDFEWLDSSMHSPVLQALEGRVGPAVVIGMKRA